jgi:hypothetical protein
MGASFAGVPAFGTRTEHGIVLWLPARVHCMEDNQFDVLSQEFERGYCGLDVNLFAGTAVHRAHLSVSSSALSTLRYGNNSTTLIADRTADNGRRL